MYKCPHCKEEFENFKIDKETDTLDCPVCGFIIGDTHRWNQG